MLKSYFRRLSGAFLTSRRGATAIEYGILAALVAVAIVAGATVIGGQLETTYNEVGNAVTAANAP